MTVSERTSIPDGSPADRAARDVLAAKPDVLVEEILAVHGDEPEWLDELAEALDRRRAGRLLERVLAVWGLSQAEAARAFGVSRQAVSKWLARGAPAERVEALGDLAAATDLLVRYLKRDRIPAVVRRAAPALGGGSLLELLGQAGARAVLEATRAMFAFERAHG